MNRASWESGLRVARDMQKETATTDWQGKSYTARTLDLGDKGRIYGKTS